jgi:hypothetical protein
MKPLILVLLLLSFQSSASKTAIKIPTELIELRKEFVKTTEEYKASLAKLKAIYEQSVVRAEEKLQSSRKLRSERLISSVQVEENERELAAAKERIIETDKQLAEADKRIKDALDDVKFEAEYRRSLSASEVRVS